MRERRRRRKERKERRVCLPSSVEEVEKVSNELGGTRGGKDYVEVDYLRIRDCCGKSRDGSSHIAS
jgi:hypothetical protein